MVPASVAESKAMITMNSKKWTSERDRHCYMD